MAVIRISNTGGNWNSTATWDGGVLPTTSDSILGDASSGQLTLNVSAQVQFLNLSAYTQTLTFNSATVLSISLAASTTSFGSGTTFAGTGTLNILNAALTINSATTSRIPNFTVNGGAKTLIGNLYVGNFVQNSAQTSFIPAGTTVYVNGNFTNNVAATVNITSNFVFDGTGNISGQIEGGTGRFILSGTSFPTINLTTIGNLNFEYIQGSVGTASMLVNYSANFASMTQNYYTSGMTWNNFNVSFVGSSQVYNLGLHQQLNINTMNIVYRSSDGGNSTIVFQQNQKLNITNILNIQGASNLIAKNPAIRFSTTPIHYINKFFGLANSNFTFLIRSATNGVKAKLELGDKNNSPLFWISFTDIDATYGQEIRTYNGTLSNTNNITSYSTDIFGGSGGGASSYTFIS